MRRIARCPWCGKTLTVEPHTENSMAGPMKEVRVMIVCEGEHTQEMIDRIRQRMQERAGGPPTP